MPELPEIETIRLQLDKFLVGKTITGVTTDSAKQVKPSLSSVKKAVLGAKIKKVSRRAKLLIIHLSNSQFLAFHLKLTGRLLFRQKNHSPDNWTHVVFSLGQNHELRFADSRKFGWVQLLNKDQYEKVLADYGPEPLTDLTFVRFQKILASTRRPIKVLLMDQAKIAGIGNIYDNDALNLAGLNPRRPASSLSEKEAKKLLKAIKKVLKAGIKYRGASDNYYLDALGQKGAYQDHFLTYARAGQKCYQCKKGKIKRVTLAGRGTFYCPACQH
jgi:formamidopyrimidine-DNA glycosylase